MNKDISNKRFFITGGGTGGHIYPAVSIIKELMAVRGAKRENIFYIGNKKNPECKIAKDNNFNFLSTCVFGMPRKCSPVFLVWIICLFVSIVKCMLFIFKYKPDVVFATGGYVAAPVLFAAQFLRIPYVLHDSDCIPGIVTRKFAKGAKAVNLAFEEANKYIKSNNVYNFKNPVRREFFEITRKNAREHLSVENNFFILIMGGSQGAKSINDAAIELIKKVGNNEKIKIILQTGKKNYDEIMKKFKPPANTRVEPYFDNMAIPILAADLIISRAGSISISEILSAGVPSILVPYPHAAANHQQINAVAIVNQGAAVCISDSNIKGDGLFNIAKSIVQDTEKYKKLKENAHNLREGYRNSNLKILNLISKAIKDDRN